MPWLEKSSLEHGVGRVTVFNSTVMRFQHFLAADDTAPLSQLQDEVWFRK